MTLLTLCQDATDAIGVGNRPDTIIGSSDINARLLLVQSKIGGTALAKRHTWEALTQEATFLTVAAQSQGLFSALGTGATDYSNVRQIFPETMWNRDETKQLFGPMTAIERQSEKSTTTSSAWSNWWIQGGALYFYPAPTVNQTIAFEFVSSYWAKSSGGTAQATWLADTDTSFFDEGLLLNDLIWRFKKARGLDYAEDFAVSEAEIKAAITADGGKRALNLRGPTTYHPTIGIKDGSWSL